MAEQYAKQQRPEFNRLETIQSEGEEGYDVLSLPSPCDEPDCPAPTYSGGFSITPQVPYMSIYSSPSRLFVGMHAGFLSGTPITVKITHVSKDSALRYPVNPLLYTIEVTHGQFKWVIYKRFKHFRELHEKLWAHRARLILPLPTKSHKERRKTVRGAHNESKLPRIPKRAEVLVSNEQIPKRQEQLESYLNTLLQSSLYKKHSATKKFLEISRFSFIRDLGEKGKEGILRKQSGGHIINLHFCDKCCNLKCRELLKQWSDRWFVVKDTFIMYLEPDQRKIKNVLLFDGKLDVTKSSKSHKITILNASRKLKVNCWTERQALEWQNAIMNTAREYAADFTGKNSNNSFAPTRHSLAHWFVDGSSYFSAVADAIEEAQEEIFITDWWLSPEIFMKRPTLGDKWQLDKLLKRKADAGIKIYILLYKEVEMAVALDSHYTKQTLQNLNSSNIRVLRHPDHITTTADSFLWAHHEKIVVIDQKIAFVGGIDLCYGRWDDHLHRLTDFGCPMDRNISVNDVVDTQVSGDHYTQKPSSSAHTTSALMIIQAMTVAVVEEVSKDPKIQEIDRNDNELNLKPLSTSSDDSTCLDKTDNRNLDEDDIPDTSKAPSLAVVQEKSTLMVSNGGGTSSAGRTYKDMVEDMKMVGQSKLWIGKDYCNFIAKDLTKLNQPYVDLISRDKTPRMPWHDIACVTYGKPARDAARHFIQRWNFTKIEKAKKGETVPFLIPKTYNDDAFHMHNTMIHSDAVNADVQILRSSAEWSAGIIEPEQSIHSAYIAAINNAEHYIYIENQFFISVRNNPDIRNKIVDALYYRILRADKEKKNFRVYVIMPLIPGFEGDISDSSKSLAIQAVMYWQYSSMSRGEGSLMGDLAKQGVNCSSYISFCGLRTHSKMGEKLVTEIIYVHSKMLIVDDRTVIIGSANINDRSMTGVRDSEVAMLVEDTEFVDSTMDGKPYKAGKFASRLRKRVFSEHLGLLPEEFVESNFEPTINIDDVCCEKFFKEVWLSTASVNATVYERVFKCVPSDSVLRFADIADYQSRAMIDVEKMEMQLKKIKGYLVLLPLFFLKHELLRPEGLTKESIAPTSLWT